MRLLHGIPRNYSWGSRTLIPELVGEEPTDSPVAEIWFGAHPNDPSTVDGKNLDDIIAADPQAELGFAVTDKFPHERLPYLVKLLAAAEPLSLQAHPTMEQAQEGFARENEADIPLTDRKRNYKDPSHKPEIIIALTDFYAMAGFRPVARTRQLLGALKCPELERYETMLDGTAADNDDEAGLRALFTTWISIPTAARKELVDAVVNAARRLIAEAAHSLPARVDQWMVDDLRTVVDLNERYPGDAGVLGALLLNHIHLAPGESIFLAAGHLHAYVRGLGVEVMANSDNVLRGGLTPKYVDVPELVKVLNFAAADDPRVAAELEATDSVSGQDAGTTGGVKAWNYPVPVDEFAVTRVELPDAESTFALPSRGPVIALCVAGTARLSSASAAAGEGDQLELQPGQAAWMSASDSAVQAGGPATIFVVRVGVDD